MRFRPLRHRPTLAVALLASLASGCVERTPGETLYREHCAHCHGVDGSGNTPRYMGDEWANLLDGSWQNVEGDEYSLARVVREGVFAKMPGNAELTEDEVREIVNWVLYLRGETR